MYQVMNLKLDSFISPRIDPLVHPGKRPRCSYILGNQKDLYEICQLNEGLLSSRINYGGSKVILNDYLKKNNSTLLEDRIPVIAYGTNPCPGQLEYKFKSLANSIVPVIKGNIKGWDTVYKFIFRGGYAYAQLIPSKNTSIEAWITLLDQVQFELMNKSEGISSENSVYKVGIFQDFYFDGLNIRSLFYAANKKILVSPKIGNYVNTPVSILEIPAENRRFPALNQIDILNHSIKIFHLEEIFERYKNSFLPFTGSYGEQLARFLCHNYNLEQSGEKCNSAYIPIVNKIQDISEKMHCKEIPVSQVLELKKTILENPNKTPFKTGDVWGRME